MLYIFDLDGTLTDTLATIAYFANGALEKYGLAPHETERYKYFVGDGRDMLIHRILAAQSEDTDENFQKVGAAYDAAYESDMLYLTKPYDGICQSLEILKSRGETLAVLSNKPTKLVEYIVKTLFADGTFDYVSGQKKEVPRKPSPEGALIIADTLGFDKSDCVFIGDTSVDINTGKNAGMTTVGVTWGFRGREELERAGADIIIENTSDIPKINL